MKNLVKTWDGKEVSRQRLGGRIRESVLRAGHRIGVLPDGRELVRFGDEWVWLLKGAGVKEIKEYEAVNK